MANKRIEPTKPYENNGKGRSFSEEDILRAVRKGDGKLKTLAADLGITTNTARAYLKKYPQAKMELSTIIPESPPRSAVARKIATSRFRDAVIETGGIMRFVANRLGVTEDALVSRVRSNEELQEAYNAEMDMLLDASEVLIAHNILTEFERVMQGYEGFVNTDDAWKLLRLRGAKRGYGESKNVNLSKTPDEIIISYEDDGQYDDDEEEEESE